MPRLRDTRTEVIVNVDDVTAKAIGAAYEPAEEPKTPAKRAAAKRASSKTEQ